jgi:hypothetical protein
MKDSSPVSNEAEDEDQLCRLIKQDIILLSLLLNEYLSLSRDVQFNGTQCHDHVQLTLKMCVEFSLVSAYQCESKIQTAEERSSVSFDQH